MMGAIRKLARSGYGIIGGVIAIGAAAAAAGAAPAALTPWSHSEPAPTTVAPTTTVAHEPLADGHPVVVTTTPAPTSAPATPPATEPVPASTAPPATEPAAPTTAPPATAPTATGPTETTAAASAGPTPTTPATTAPPAEPAGTPDGGDQTPNDPAPPAEPAPTGPADTQPATTAAPVSDNVVPAGLSLSCSAATGDGATNVTCDWSGPVPTGFSSYLLLRGNQTARGRVPFASADPSAHHFTDVALAPGSYTYVVVIIDANSKTLVHSNMVPITSPAG